MCSMRLPELMIWIRLLNKPFPVATLDKKERALENPLGIAIGRQAWRIRIERLGHVLMLTLKLPSPPHFESLRFPVKRLDHIVRRHGLTHAPAKGQQRRLFEEMFGTHFWELIVKAVLAGRLKNHSDLQQQFALLLCQAWQEGWESQRLIGPYHYRELPQGFQGLEAVADSGLIVIVHLGRAGSHRPAGACPEATLTTAFFAGHPATGYLVSADEAYRRRLRRHHLI